MTEKNEPYLSPEDLKKDLKDAEQNVRDYLFKEVASPLIRPSPFKSQSAAEQDAKQQIDKVLETFKQDIVLATQLYLQKVPEREREKLIEIFRELTQFLPHGPKAGTAISLPWEKAEFLEKYAIEELAAGRVKEACSMFRFIIQICPKYSPGWVGWSRCEEALGETANLEAIFAMAMQTMPEDHLIRLQAAQYFMKTQRQGKARDLLEESRDALLKANEHNSETLFEIDRLLRELQE